MNGAQLHLALNHLPSIQKSLIHDHEEAAEAALIASGLLAAVARGTLLLERKRALPSALVGAVLAGTLGVSGAMGWAAHLGGLIRHPELSNVATEAGGSGSAVKPASDDR